ncbi:hypothetical protein JCGZ_23041 [Jatropha curcas]|uniref:Aminotransferase-like plant mobile domain-containing protein n=1 Tax=Jatropha curcas TaxID=180498 RepID=A0A067JPV9_JATCU|nr:hypothetical protein JCGZ_23041 [Jatropha curcas]
MASSDLSGEDFLDSLGISLEEVNLTVDANIHSVTGVFAQDPRVKVDVGETSMSEIPLEIFDPNHPIGVIINPSHLGYLRHHDMGRSSHKELLCALAERWRGELTATQAARFTLLLLFASTFWSNRKESFNPSILKSLENLAHLKEYDWAGAILSRGNAKDTWAYEYFPFTRPELVHADLGLGLVPLAWRWYQSNLHTVQHKKSLKDLRAFFDSCRLEQVEIGAMIPRLQNWIQVNPLIPAVGCLVSTEGGPVAPRPETILPR